MAADLFIEGDLFIPSSDLSWHAVRAGGAGGQHINKVSTKVDLRFDLEGTRALTGATKSRLRKLAKGRLDATGRIITVSQATRNRTLNLDDARNRLAALIRQALHPPKARRKTKPSRGSVKRRLNAKRMQSEKKRGRDKFRP